VAAVVVYRCGVDEVGGDVAEFAVTRLGNSPQDGEGFAGVDAALSHDDANGLVDDFAGCQRFAQLLFEDGLVGVAQNDGERGRGLAGEGFAASGFDAAEAVRDGGVEVQPAADAAVDDERQRPAALIGCSAWRGSLTGCRTHQTAVADRLETSAYPRRRGRPQPVVSDIIMCCRNRRG
jgi:hypothetical protein